MLPLLIVVNTESETVISMVVVDVAVRVMAPIPKTAVLLVIEVNVELMMVGVRLYAPVIVAVKADTLIMLLVVAVTLVKVHPLTVKA